MVLLGKLSLKHEAALGGLVKKVGAIGQAVIAELLGQTLSIRPLRALLDEIIEESEDLKVEALQAVIFVIIQLLGDGVVVALEEVLTLLV